MVLLTITPALLEAIEHYDAKEVDEKDEKLDLPEAKLGQPISHSQIIAISRALRQGSSEYHMDQLLRGARLYVKPPEPKPEPTPEYKALMARLRKEQEQRDYAVMTAQSTTAAALSTAGQIGALEKDDDEDEMTYADVNRQLTLVLNVLISIVFCAVAIWMTAWHWATPVRLFASMGGGLVVGVAEVVIYAGYIRRLKEARTKERKKKEVRKIAETWQTTPKKRTTSSKGPSLLKEALGTSGAAVKDEQTTRRRKGNN